MNTRPTPLIKIEKVRSLLFDESEYIIEFAEASIESFTEFSESYARYLPERDLLNLKRAGHKITPVAELLELDQVLGEYRYSKEMLANNADEEELRESVRRVRRICSRITDEFHDIMNKIKKGKYSK